MTPYTTDVRTRQVNPPTGTNGTIANGGPYHTGINRAPVIHHVCTTNNNPDGHLKHYFLSSEPSSSIDLDEWKSVKCVLVGDAAVGKTSLIVSYTTNGYPQEYVPTAFDNYSVSVRVDNQPIKLQLCDTAGQDDFDSLRPLCYPNTDVFLVCFSVVNPTSFQNIQFRWLPEIRHHSDNAPFILVGTECDLRTNIKVILDLHRHQLNPITESQARQFASEIGAAAYLECSSLTLQNLKETFDAAILIGLKGSAGPVSQEKAGYRQSGISSGPSAAGRKSLQKLKEKLTASRTNSIDSVKNHSWKYSDQLGPGQSTTRYSTHSAASHANVGRRSDKKLSTASVPTTGAELNTVVMNKDGGGGGPGHRYTIDGPNSPVIKSRRGWRRLLCVA